jgi:hypothetical protein
VFNLCTDIDEPPKLYHRRRNITFLYPSLEHHRPLLEQLTPAGMSSDEEEKIGTQYQYKVHIPIWRSDIVTAWLRIFDALYAHARREGVFGDKRGSQPRQRVTAADESTRRGVVPRLPRNAYDDEWFNTQVNAETLVRPGPPARYVHDARTLE